MRDLDGRHPNPRNDLANDGGIVGCVEGTVQFQQFADLIETERGLGIPKPPQHPVDPAVDILRRP